VTLTSGMGGCGDMYGRGFPVLVVLYCYQFVRVYRIADLGII